MPHQDNSRRSLAIASHRDAALHVQRLGTQLLDDLKSRSRLPTKLEQAERLRDINKTAKKLLSQLNFFQDPTGLLRLVAVESGFFQPVRFKNGPGYELVDWDIILAKPLALLAEISANNLETLDKAIKGAGHQRLHDRLFGDPRLSLAVRAAWLITECRGADAVKSTENGMLHRLVNEVWHYATGLDPEDYNLGSFVKKGVAEWRRHHGRGPVAQLHTDFNRLRRPRLQP